MVGARLMVTEVKTVAEEPVGIDPVNTALPPNGTSAESTVRVTVPTDARDLDTFSTAPIIIRAASRDTVPASLRYLICFLMYLVSPSFVFPAKHRGYQSNKAWATHGCAHWEPG